MHVFDIHATANIFGFSNCATIIRLIPFWTGKTFAITLHSNCFFLLLFSKNRMRKELCARYLTESILPWWYLLMKCDYSSYFSNELVLQSVLRKTINMFLLYRNGGFFSVYNKTSQWFFANSPSAQHYNQWVFLYTLTMHGIDWKEKYSHENKKWTESSLLVYLVKHRLNRFSI